MEDDINAQLKEIIPERVDTFYTIAEKYAMPSTVEHLASFVHLLPQDRIKDQYKTITNIKNPALQERLLWKFGQLPKEMQPFAIRRLASIVDEPEIKEKVISMADRIGKEDGKDVREIFVQRAIQEN